MTLTQFLAGWGAAVSTSVAVWNVYKDVIKRERLEVSVAFMVTFTDATDKQDVFDVTAINHGDKTITVTHIGIHPTWHRRWPIIARLLFRKVPARAYLLSLSPLYNTLPRKIEPRQRENFIYTLKAENFPPAHDIYVVTADGKQWYAHRRAMSAVREAIKEAGGGKEDSLARRPPIQNV